VEYFRAKDLKPERMAKKEAWQKSKHGREIINQRIRKDRICNKAKYRAKEMVEYRVNRGIIEQQPCIVCGNTNSMGHHPDYTKPLEVMWLCQKHHSEIHHKLNPEPAVKE